MVREQIERAIEAAYDGAVSPDGWSGVLEALARAFGCHFADVFARTDDYASFSGLAYGMDRADYEAEFLGVWVARNVWGSRHPVRAPDEVITTRRMVAKAELLRSDMHRLYLGPRDLDEGLRMTLLVGDGWVQDVSLLRSWAAGPYSRDEMRAARTLQPHLRRSAAIARRLRRASALTEAGAQALEALPQGVMLLDADGRVVWANRRAEAMTAPGGRLRADAAGLRAADRASDDALRRVVARAAGSGGRRPESGRCALPGAASLTATPLPRRAEWTLLRPPAVLALIDAPEPPDGTQDGAQDDPRALYGLTKAEAALARALASGRTVVEVAAAQGRSVNTIRTHLARLMAKTETTRQADLVRLLIGAGARRRAAEGPFFP